MAVLTTRTRNALPASAFALAGRRYPIMDRAHAQNALARVAQFGTPRERTQVRAAVRKRFPTLSAALAS